MFTTRRHNIYPPWSGKFVTSVTSSMLKKPWHVSVIKILRSFFSTLFITYVYHRVSFSVVDIIISKDEEIFGLKILMTETTFYFKQDILMLFFHNSFGTSEFSNCGNQVGADWMENMRWTNTKPAFRETNMVLSMHFRKANTNPTMQFREVNT